MNQSQRLLEQALTLAAQIQKQSLYGQATPQRPPFRISPHPFSLSPKDLAWLEALGPALWRFYQVCNRLYWESLQGRVPAWVARYLDQGKPERVVELGRMKRFRPQLPRVIRPDLILTEQGMMLTELDWVPGGIGLMAFLAQAYSAQGAGVLGDSQGMVEGFARMIRSGSQHPDPVLAIVVSEESRDYRPEMEYLVRELERQGWTARVLDPREVRFQEGGLYFDAEGKRYTIHVLYRFFEMFDLKNIPRVDLMLYAAKTRKVWMTPPPKAFLEEKLWAALLHHPGLQPYWEEGLGEAWEILIRCTPKTWILDPQPVPPHAVIPELTFQGRPLQDWRILKDLSQRERSRFLIKISGFSPRAWGSRGIVFGEDASGVEWAQALEAALNDFPRNPWILQEYHRGKRVSVTALDPQGPSLYAIEGRVRLSPYYFVWEEEGQMQVTLGGVLATICPLDKRAIHGMVDSVMVPVGALTPQSREG